jgi:hypothetical protein
MKPWQQGIPWQANTVRHTKHTGWLPVRSRDEISSWIPSEEGFVHGGCHSVATCLRPCSPPVQWVIGIKIALAASLLAGLGLAAFGQSFQNLDFESASLIPVSGSYQGEVEIGPALPGWSVFTQVPYVLYDSMFLDSAGVSILDTNRPYGFQVLTQTIQGRFTLLLQGGFSLSYPAGGRLSAAIAQTGLVPAGVRTLLFDGAMYAGETNFTVSVAGQSLPFYALASYTNYILYGLDISGFSGQTQEIRFTAYPNPPPGAAIVNFYLDNIRFSISPLHAPPLILTPPLSQAVGAGSNVQFTVIVAVTGSPAPTYQWLFNGTNAITGATNANLQLNNLQLWQSGLYSVVVSNAFGAVSSPTATLTVIGFPPAIVAPPVDETVGIGGSADFTVNAVGSPPLMYQWFFRGNPVSGASSSDLYLANLQLSQSGTYAVVVTNAFGAVTSSPATLTVTAVVQTNPPAGTVVGWGYNYFGQSTVPPGLSGAVAIAAGEGHSLTLQSDGTVVAWGDNRFGQCTVPTGLRGVIAIAAGASQSLALKAGGTVVGWGDNSFGESANPAGLGGVIAIAAGGWYSLVLKSDSTVVAWGLNDYHQTNVPPGLSNVIAISAGSSHSLALKSDGTVVAWGDNSQGQTNVPLSLTGVIAIAAGGVHSLALRSDGTLVGWGNNLGGQSTVPAGLTGVIAIAAGGFNALSGGHSLALKSDRTLVAWGSNDSGQTNVPASLTGVVAITAGGWHSLAITAKPIIQTPPANQTAELGSPVSFCVRAVGYAPLVNHWFFNGTNAISAPATNSCLGLSAVQFSQAGAYTVVVTNTFGAVTSAPALLSVIPPVERRIVPALTLGGQTGGSLHLENRGALDLTGHWLALDTVTLTNPPQFYFDLSLPLPPQGFYRAWQLAPLAPPTLDLHMVPAITVSGAVGTTQRVDYINQFGPIDGWVALATITLTNTSQLYFDTSVVGQPPRLWRIVQVP